MRKILDIRLLIVDENAQEVTEEKEQKLLIEFLESIKKAGFKANVSHDLFSVEEFNMNENQKKIDLITDLHQSKN